MKQNSTLHSQTRWVEVPAHDLDGVGTSPEVLVVYHRGFASMAWVAVGGVGAVGSLPLSLPVGREIKQKGLVRVGQGAYSTARGPLKNRLLVLQSRLGTRTASRTGSIPQASRGWARKPGRFYRK